MLIRGTHLMLKVIVSLHWRRIPFTKPISIQAFQLIPKLSLQTQTPNPRRQRKYYALKFPQIIALVSGAGVSEMRRGLWPTCPGFAHSVAYLLRPFPFGSNHQGVNTAKHNDYQRVWSKTYLRWGRQELGKGPSAFRSKLFPSGSSLSTRRTRNMTHFLR
jgi:hypothetical protein